MKIETQNNETVSGVILVDANGQRTMLIHDDDKGWVIESDGRELVLRNGDTLKVITVVEWRVTMLDCMADGFVGGALLNLADVRDD